MTSTHKTRNHCLLLQEADPYRSQTDRNRENHLPDSHDEARFATMHSLARSFFLSRSFSPSLSLALSFRLPLFLSHREITAPWITTVVGRSSFISTPPPPSLFSPQFSHCATLLTVGARARHHYLRRIIRDQPTPRKKRPACSRICLYPPPPYLLLSHTQKSRTSRDIAAVRAIQPRTPHGVVGCEFRLVLFSRTTARRELD